MTCHLEIQNVSFQTRSKHTLLQDVSACIPANSFTSIIGSNGAGKSSLLKCIGGELGNYSGKISWHGKSMHDWNDKVIAQTRGVLRQQYAMNLPFKAEEIIAMGRYPHPSSSIELNNAIINRVAEYVGVQHLLKRNYLTLSGGEQQRVQLARVLAQVWDDSDKPKLILLDEPVSAIDIRYQHQLLSIVKSLCKFNFTIVTVLHDLNLAMQYSDYTLLMKNGKTLGFDKTTTVLSEANIEEALGIQVNIFNNEKVPYPFVSVFHQKNINVLEVYSI